MQSGEQQPFISTQTVREALGTLLYTASSQSDTNALEALLLVDEFLANPDLPPHAFSRSMAIQHVLTSIITEQLQVHREKLGLSQPILSDSLEAAISTITADFQQGSVELIGWSLLYYRYIRVDLGLGYDTLGELAHVDERTLRRYLNHGVRRLTEWLINAEWDARARYRNRRLYGALPYSTPIPVIGRDETFRQAQSLINNHMPRHLQITGPPGIGKSVFVQEFLRQRIDSNLIDQLIWIDEPGSVEYVHQYLIENLLPEDYTLGCREYMLLSRVAIVLDGIQALQADHSTLERLLTFLSPAEVYVISRAYFPLTNIAGHITLHELVSSDSAQLIYRTLTTDALSKDQYLSDNDVASIQDAVGGNPLAVRLAARNFVFGITSLGESLDRIYDQVYALLSPGCKYAWLASTLFSPSEISLDSLPALWPLRIAPFDVIALQRHHIVERKPDNPEIGWIASSARRYIQTKYKKNRENQNWVDTLLNDLDRQINRSPRTALSVVEHVLLTNWPEVNAARRLAWVTDTWREGLTQGHYARWREILEHTVKHSQTVQPEIKIAYGICLRRLAEWPQARRAFEEVISDTGKRGAFCDQAKALREMAILCRYQGNYEQAVLLLRRVEQFTNRRTDDSLRRQVRLELAQLAVDRNDGIEAELHLSELSSKSGRTLVLRSEAALLRGEYEECNLLATHALTVLQDDNRALARIHTVLGRNYNRQGNHEKAYQHLAHALVLLEKSGDVFGLARIQSNLGAVLIDKGSYEEAYDLLTRAEHVQSTLGDHIALAATQHNLQLLRNWVHFT